MGILDRFKRKKKEEEVVLPVETLPSDLERFRVSREPPVAGYPRAELPRPPEIGPPVAETRDRIELVLQKLDTIDARLRWIEERLMRRR